MVDPVQYTVYNWVIIKIKLNFWYDIFLLEN